MRGWCQATPLTPFEATQTLGFRPMNADGRLDGSYLYPIYIYIQPMSTNC